ncbi:hypothetical protein PWP93_30565 [Paraburkholderia sp. A1RI-2L]|uniref:hypothetical protein n=1 Tax=Paraburkholderia sp. A1RI-2L TaxID=3028367 RepID=UPI003B7F8EC2
MLDAALKLRERASIVIVEHQADMVLPIADRAYVLVNGRVAYENSAGALEQDALAQARLLGIVNGDAGTTLEMKSA